MKVLEPVKLGWKGRLLQSLGVSSVEEEIRRFLKDASLEDYPLELEACREVTLTMLLGKSYNKKCLNSMHNESNLKSYFFMEYKTKGYLKFERHYKASRFLVEDLIEKVYLNIHKDELVITYDLGDVLSREYTLDLKMLKAACADSIKYSQTTIGVNEATTTFISQYAKLLVADIKHFGFKKFDIEAVLTK